MNDSSGDSLPNAVVIAPGAIEYTVIAGESVEIEISLTNPGPSGDYFLVSS